MKTGAPEEFLLKKYCIITDRVYNRVIYNEPEVIVKVKSYELEKKKSSKTIGNINFLYFCNFVFF